MPPRHRHNQPNAEPSRIEGVTGSEPRGIADRLSAQLLSAMLGEVRFPWLLYLMSERNRPRRHHDSLDV